MLNTPVIESISTMIENTKTEPLDILLISVHGLIRGQILELRQDADTGGQPKYVVELAKQPNVDRVNLVTRRIPVATVDPDYAEPIEILAENTQIVRMDAGSEGYICKEDLWNHPVYFPNNFLSWLHDQQHLPDILHSQYADAGYVAVPLAQRIGLPQNHTDHALRRNKYRRVLTMGMPMEAIEPRHRIDAEDNRLTYADVAITCTRNEIADQYKLYDCYTPDKMTMVPQGIDFKIFHPPTSCEQDFAFAQKIGMPVNEPIF
jgi:sucrose-phosphate synthase